MAGRYTRECLAEAANLRLLCLSCHRNGDWRDDREQNLRLRCPNCHAETDTWCRGEPHGAPRPDRRSIEPRDAPVP
ncbi:hypothetical protein SUDANB171_01661 [Streptomyces sp. enrichment culture]